MLKSEHETGRNQAEQWFYPLLLNHLLGGIHVMSRFSMCLVLLATVFVFGCSQHSSAIETEKQQWSREGWKYLETFGTPADDAVYVAHMDSSTARSVTAFALSGGVSTNHIYEQTSALYLVVTMQRPSGDTFTLIFEKPKP